MPQSSPAKGSAWYKAETVLIAGSIGSSIAAVVLQQVTLAAVTSIQLSLVVGIGSWNRKRFDEVNQQNQAVITQLQQQLLQGQQSFDQVTQATQQLPTYAEIGDLQNHIERLEADHQKYTNQLNGELRHQENQLSQLKNELTSLHQNLQSASSIEVDLLQDKIDNLKDYLEIKVETLKENFNRLSTDRLEDRLFQFEQMVEELPKTAFVESLFDSYSQEVESKLKTLNIFKSSFPDEFDPVVLCRDTRGVLNRIKDLESEFQENNIVLKEILAEKTKSKNIASQTNELLDFEFIQSEIDELDRRNNNLCNEVELLKESMASHSKNVSHRIQRNQIEVTAWLSQLEKEIQKIRYDVNRASSSSKENKPGKKTQYNEPICDRCGKVCKSFVKGKVLDYIFCSQGCSDLHRKFIEMEGH